MYAVLGTQHSTFNTHHLYSVLDKLDHMRAYLEVHIVAVNGNMNWCGILYISRFINEVTVRRQYKISILLLHLDKGMLVGQYVLIEIQECNNH